MGGSYTRKNLSQIIQILTHNSEHKKKIMGVIQQIPSYLFYAALNWYFIANVDQPWFDNLLPPPTLVSDDETAEQRLQNTKAKIQIAAWILGLAEMLLPLAVPFTLNIKNEEMDEAIQKIQENLEKERAGKNFLRSKMFYFERMCWASVFGGGATWLVIWLLHYVGFPNDLMQMGGSVYGVTDLGFWLTFSSYMQMQGKKYWVDKFMQLKDKSGKDKKGKGKPDFVIINE